ncbi:hypothetical protein BFJ63_vAg20070 [Fusarium oxysporum f. sp. narcissi]|uniref:Uncharacterized protein n=1 Tax=Fusarium oxysporum f. sp. narcissi TaxID=451672 RepID=A0A4Q2USA8_FUSOX|nr:hypothetical protein QL093DRAFT_2355959 [Fusarium oxysporum]RYC77055.1 hypothetical protein BFJ63_vAg20070 [Fusarium oxysporum f. sp. narcissi]
MWGISVFQDLYFSLVLAFRAGKKNKTRSANHAYVCVDCYDNLLLSDSESVSSFERPASDK